MLGLEPTHTMLRSGRSTLQTLGTLTVVDFPAVCGGGRALEITVTKFARFDEFQNMHQVYRLMVKCSSTTHWFTKSRDSVGQRAVLHDQQNTNRIQWLGSCSDAVVDAMVGCNG